LVWFGLVWFGWVGGVGKWGGWKGGGASTITDSVPVRGGRLGGIGWAGCWCGWGGRVGGKWVWGRVWVVELRRFTTPSPDRARSTFPATPRTEQCDGPGGGARPTRQLVGVVLRLCEHDGPPPAAPALNEVGHERGALRPVRGQHQVAHCRGGLLVFGVGGWGGLLGGEGLGRVGAKRPRSSARKPKALGPRPGRPACGPPKKPTGAAQKPTSADQKPRKQLKSRESPPKRAQGPP
jgi:hypothetical protein